MELRQLIGSCIVYLSVILTNVILVPATSFAAQVDFSWLPNKESLLGGYVIHYGTSSGTYIKTVDIGNPTVIDGKIYGTVTGLTEGLTYYFAVTAIDTDGIKSDYSEEIEWTVPLGSGSEYIIDNGDPETSSTGTWKLSSGSDYYGSQSSYSFDSNAVYTYESTFYGRHQLSLWWTAHDSRCTDVPVHIYDGTILLDTISINQLNSPGQWNVLGTYNFTSDTGKVVVVSSGNSCSTNADAVRFVGSQSELDHMTVTGQTSTTGGSNEHYNAQAYYDDGSNASVEPEWSIDCLDVADISETGLLTVYDVYQDEICTVSALYEENGIEVTADLDIVIKYVTTDVTEIIIDNGDAESLPRGTWKQSSGPNYYGTRSEYSFDNNAIYSYEVAVDDSSSYELSLWWTAHDSRCTDVPVHIYDGTILLDTISINQLNSPGQWNVLGTYNFTSGTGMVVVVSSGNSCSTNADAVRFLSGN